MEGTFVFSFQNVQGSYYWELSLQLTESSMDNYLKVFSIVLTFMKVEKMLVLTLFLLTS